MSDGRKIRVHVTMTRQDGRLISFWNDLRLPSDMTEAELISIDHVSVVDKHEDESVTKHFSAGRGKRGKPDKVTFYDDPIPAMPECTRAGKEKEFYDNMMAGVLQCAREGGLDCCKGV
jgi:hypothetical protein